VLTARTSVSIIKIRETFFLIPLSLIEDRQNENTDPLRGILS
jgi:hypothetical protein